MEKCALLADRLWGHWGGEDQAQGGIQQQNLGITHSQILYLRKIMLFINILNKFELMAGFDPCDKDGVW